MKTRRITCARHWIALLLCFGMLLPAMSATVFAADGDFAEGRSITYYAKASENELFGMLADYNADGTGLEKWNQVLTDENEIYYSQKTVPGADHQPYCAFQFGTEAIDWGIGEEDIQDTLCLTKTYHQAVSDSITAEGYYQNGNVVAPFNGRGSSSFSANSLRFVAYNTKPDYSGAWYRQGQILPEGVDKLYVYFVSPTSMAGQITDLAEGVETGIALNGQAGVYTAQNPYFVPVVDGKLGEDALYYTAYLNMGEIASLFSWARTDELALGINTTFVELTIQFDSRLDLFSDSDTFTFQYNGGFVPYRNDAFLQPDNGSICTYTIEVSESEMADNTLTLLFGLNEDVCRNSQLTLDAFSQMSLTVLNQPGAKAAIPEELAEYAAGSLAEEGDPSFIVTKGTLKISAALAKLPFFPQSVEVDVDPVYAQLRESTPLTLRIQDMTAYTGGDSISEDSFPSVRYQIEGAGETDVGSLIFKVGDREFRAEAAGDYWLLPGLENTFTEESGAVVEDDGVAGIYEIGVANGDACIVMDDDGNLYDISIVTGELIVRNVSEPDGVLSGDTDLAQPVVDEAGKVNTENGLAAAVIPSGTAYYTNGKEELGVLGDNESDAPQISLLFDELLPGENGEDTRQLLIGRAEQAGYELTEENSQFKYLDLINENDGNAWVSTSDGTAITIYWPCPEGVTADNFIAQVLHFKGLHREYRGDLENQIRQSEVEIIDASIADGNIVFTLTGNQALGSFSPFAIVWQEKVDITVTKNWQDYGNAERVRPYSVTIKLLANGRETGKELVLNRNNSWTGSFDRLDPYADGKMIEYTVTEERVAGYTASISGSAETGFTVTNTYTPGKPVTPAGPEEPVTPEGTDQPESSNPGQETEQPEQPPREPVPQTGDRTDLGLWIALLAISGTGVAAILVLAGWKGLCTKHKK